MSLRHVDPPAHPSWFARKYAAFAATPVARWVSRHVNWKIDPLLLRVTGGRFASTLIFPTALLEQLSTTGGSTPPRHLLPRRQRRHDRGIECRGHDRPGLVSQPPRQPGSDARRRDDAGEHRRRRR